MFNRVILPVFTSFCLLFSSGSAKCNSVEDFVRAAANGSLKLVKSSINSGMGVNIINFKGITALIASIEYEQFETVKYLVEEGADVNYPTQDDYRSTPLCMAALTGNEKILKYLIKNGAQVDKKSKMGATPLLVASRFGFTEIVAILIKKGADVSITDINGCTALMNASMENHSDIAKLLIDKATDIDAVDKYGADALFWATLEGNSEIVSYLISEGADVNSPAGSSIGRTALMYAAEKGYTEIVRELLETDVNLHVRSKDSKTALNFALDNNHQEIAVMLKLAGAK